MKNTADKIAPSVDSCPFCNGFATIEQGDPNDVNSSIIVCTECSASGPVMHGDDEHQADFEVAKHWNTRHRPNEEGLMLEADIALKHADTRFRNILREVERLKEIIEIPMLLAHGHTEPFSLQIIEVSQRVADMEATIKDLRGFCAEVKTNANKKGKK